MNSIGVITRCVAAPLRGDFTRYATLPSGSTLTRPAATAGRAMYRQSRSSASRSSASTRTPACRLNPPISATSPRDDSAQRHDLLLLVVLARALLVDPAFRD
jgi:hypothetical protein